MEPKTKADMDHRFSSLLSYRMKADMSLRQSAEYDVIQNWGLEGWTEWLRKQERKRMKKGKRRG